MIALKTIKLNWGLSRKCSGKIGKLRSPFERFLQAQVLWDETMAEKIAQFVKANPDYQVVVLAGKGHIVYGYGIPSRVERRLGVGKVKMRSVLFNFTTDSPSSTEKPIADYVWRH
jgi:uncharacterized iron-regulated protein